MLYVFSSGIDLMYFGKIGKNISKTPFPDLSFPWKESKKDSTCFKPFPLKLRNIFTSAHGATDHNRRDRCVVVGAAATPPRGKRAAGLRRCWLHNVKPNEIRSKDIARIYAFGSKMNEGYMLHWHCVGLEARRLQLQPFTCIFLASLVCSHENTAWHPHRMDPSTHLRHKLWPPQSFPRVVQTAEMTAILFKQPLAKPHTFKENKILFRVCVVWRIPLKNKTKLSAWRSAAT